MDRSKVQSLSTRLNWLLTGDVYHEAMYAGVTVGIVITLSLCCVFCFCRRYKKKMVKKPARSYMMYGESEGPGDATEMSTTADDRAERNM